MKLIGLLTVSNLFALEVVQSCKHCQLCVLQGNSTISRNSNFRIKMNFIFWWFTLAIVSQKKLYLLSCFILLNLGCAPGEGLNSQGECYPCGPGTYSDGYICVSCPAGYTSSDTRATHASSCTCMYLKLRKIKNPGI